jgi:hypothetical protein
MYILFSNIVRVVWIWPVCVHVTDGVVDAFWIKCVVVAQYQLSNLLVDKAVSNYVVWRECFILSWEQKKSHIKMRPVNNFSGKLQTYFFLTKSLLSLMDKYEAIFN